MLQSWLLMKWAPYTLYNYIASEKCAKYPGVHMTSGNCADINILEYY